MDARTRWLAAVFLVLLCGPARAFFGLSLGDQRLFFFEPALEAQEGKLDATLDAATPDFEFEQFEGSAFGVAYGAAFHAAGEGVRGRWDTYRLRAGLLPGPMKFFEKTLRLGFGLRAGAELRFLRHFPSGRAAAAAAPMRPWVLGSVDSILAGMNPGDLASLPVDAEFLLRAALDTPLAGIPARPSVFLKLGGQFSVGLLRLEGEKVRLRITSLRSATGGAAFKAGMIWDVELIELLGERVKFLTEFRLAKASWTKKYGDGVMLDATLDLGDPAVRAAFETLFYRPVQLATRRGKILSVGWPLLQDLAAADRDRDPEDRRVVLHRAGLMRFGQTAWKMKLGNSLLRFGRKDLTTRLRFEPYRPGAPAIALAAHLEVAKRTVLFRRREKSFSESQVLAADQDGALRPALWTFRYRLKDSRLSPREARELRRVVRFHLGAVAPPEIPAFGPGRPAVKADIRIRISDRGLRELAARSPDELAEAWDAWLRRADPGDFWLTTTALPVGRLPAELHAALAGVADAPDEAAVARLAGLRRSNLAFRELGAGFLASLLGPREGDDRIQLYLRLKSPGGPNIRWRRGAIAADPTERLLPVLRFLETGVPQLQRDALQAALAARAAREEFAARAE